MIKLYNSDGNGPLQNASSQWRSEVTEWFDEYKNLSHATAFVVTKSPPKLTPVGDRWTFMSESGFELQVGEHSLRKISQNEHHGTLRLF